MSLWGRSYNEGGEDRPAPTAVEVREGNFEQLLRDCFSMAKEMCGSHHPADIARDQLIVTLVERETFRRLREAKKK